MEKLQRSDSLWEKLKAESRPIFLYGTGNGADKILDVCKEFGIRISGVFASSGFVRNRYFREMKVRSLEDIECEYPDFVVLLSFGTTLPDVMENIRRIGEKHTLYIPEVPLYGTELFDYDRYEKCFERIERAEELFEEDTSRKLFSHMVAFRLTGDPKYLTLIENPEESYRNLLGGHDIKTIIDCGAYRGDSTYSLINALSPEAVYAAEPDPGTFKKLVAYAAEEHRSKVVPVNCAVGDRCGEIEISASAGRGSGAAGTTKGAKNKTVPLKTVDSLVGDQMIDLIKYDVEGDEWEALHGSENIIERDAPSLAVSVYHRTDDLYDIPLRIKELCPKHGFYLRRADCIPAWDIVLFAVKKP